MILDLNRHVSMAHQSHLSGTSLCILVFLTIVPNSRYNVNSLNYGHKVWTQSLSLDKADGWYGGKIPCPGQKIILPENEVVYFPDTLTLGPEIQLPQNGMILFPSSGECKIKYNFIVYPKVRN